MLRCLTGEPPIGDEDELKQEMMAQERPLGDIWFLVT